MFDSKKNSKTCFVDNPCLQVTKVMNCIETRDHIDTTIQKTTTARHITACEFSPSPDTHSQWHFGETTCRWCSTWQLIGTSAASAHSHWEGGQGGRHRVRRSSVALPDCSLYASTPLQSPGARRSAARGHQCAAPPRSVRSQATGRPVSQSGHRPVSCRASGVPARSPPHTGTDRSSGSLQNSKPDRLLVSAETRNGDKERREIFFREEYFDVCARHVYSWFMSCKT